MRYEQLIITFSSNRNSNSIGMELFSSTLIKYHHSDPTPWIITPVGVVSLDAMIGAISFATLPPSESYLLPQDGQLYCWNSTQYQAELLICRPIYSLPGELRVDDCWAGLWRLKANSPLPISTFICEWKELPQGLDREPSSGEGLAAQTWDNGLFYISLGTEDEDYLYRRNLLGETLPKRWLLESCWIQEPTFGNIRYGKNDRIEYTTSGFRLSVPEMEPSEWCQIQFIVAWSNEDPLECATWFAVDRSPEEILAAYV